MNHLDGRTTSGIIEKPIDVVVVEDEPDHRELLVGILREGSFLVREASTAIDGLGLVLAKAPDVVVSDLDLGAGPGGWLLAERLRSGSDTRHIGRIAVTGRVEPRDEIARAFDAYLRKPVDAALLRSLVTQLGAISRSEQLLRSAR